MKTFQQQFEQLEQIVARFERGDIDLDEGLKEFEKGLSIAQELKKRLKDAGNKLEVLKKKFKVSEQTEKE